ncbi:MOSC domain-containing protein [Rhizobium sp.]|jgi:uncharacterized protein|uniref:MOSC domain-containing protein n=1 Tax=Rhizobium sp. TaxID=391 RepID=UPI000E94E311|nr:MOSC domain-containing protein [Rhizobium sp.]
MKISAISIYPLKSARGIDLIHADVLPRGLVGDRIMMLVSPSGAFLTQREIPALARVQAREDGGHYHLGFDNHRSLHLSQRDFSQRKSVTVWRSTVDVVIANEETNSTLSTWFGQPLELALFDDQAHRTANEQWAGPNTPITFTDGYQVLITNTASLAALNADMAAYGEGSIGMDRFRANIVIDCDQPWAEDQWASLSIGGIIFDLVKPCSRCIITTQDQTTGSRDQPSPMAAMGRMRMSADPRVRGVLFGWNAVPRAHGVIRVGDTADVLHLRTDGIPLKQRG